MKTPLKDDSSITPPASDSVGAQFMAATAAKAKSVYSDHSESRAAYIIEKAAAEINRINARINQLNARINQINGGFSDQD